MNLKHEALKLSDSIGVNSNTNEHLINSVREHGEHVALRLFIAHLRAGNYDLYPVKDLFYAMKARHMERIEERATVSATRIYSQLRDLLPQFIEYTPEQRRHLLMTAALSGETNVELVCEVIRERRPKDGDEFKAAMELAHSVPTPSLSSGVL